MLEAVPPGDHKRLLAGTKERGAHGWTLGQVVRGPTGEMALL
jgi:hypothetical protein